MPSKAVHKKPRGSVAAVSPLARGKSTRLPDPIQLEVFSNALLSIAEEMGALLIRTAYSTNIKERHDASTAIFDAEGRLITQAEHIPMHLGAILPAFPHFCIPSPLACARPCDAFCWPHSNERLFTHLALATVAPP